MRFIDEGYPNMMLIFQATLAESIYMTSCLSETFCIISQSDHLTLFHRRLGKTSMRWKWARWSDCIISLFMYQLSMQKRPCISVMGRGGGPDYCAFTSYEEFLNTVAFGVTLYFLVVVLSSRFLFLGHLSYSGDLLLWFGVRRLPSCVNIFFSRTTGPVSTKSGMKHLVGEETRKYKFHEP